MPSVYSGFWDVLYLKQLNTSETHIQIQEKAFDLILQREGFNLIIINLLSTTGRFAIYLKTATVILVHKNSGLENIANSRLISLFIEPSKTIQKCGFRSVSLVSSL